MSNEDHLSIKNIQNFFGQMSALSDTKDMRVIVIYIYILEHVQYKIKHTVDTVMILLILSLANSCL